MTPRPSLMDRPLRELPDNAPLCPPGARPAWVDICAELSELNDTAAQLLTSVRLIHKMLGCLC
jgi:hypothetical protein